MNDDERIKDIIAKIWIYHCFLLKCLVLGNLFAEKIVVSDMDAPYPSGRKISLLPWLKAKSGWGVSGNHNLLAVEGILTSM